MLHVICGIDEAGRGPVIGPLIVAAVAVENDLCLRELHVKDSKTLTKKKRDELAPQIRERAAVDVIVVSAAEIDTYRLTGSLNELEVDCFAELLRRFKPEEAYADAADVSEERFAEAIIQKLDTPVKLTACHKADTIYPVVSAASVIAKTVRDALVEEIHQEFGEPIGSGYPGDETTRKFIERWIRQHGTFPPHTRTSWKTAKEIGSRAKITKLTEWTD